ncbi:MAG TPA: type II toxin-antitoxin system prevent-host-death family antitoxin [Candidatus Paceibacterota bacterium]|nr:type II toxin-antitoxin system prevent-host-death family antitoxin [Candidatus Paceibacterota bacterium]
MENTIDLKELMQNTNRYIIAVSKGKEFVVLKRSKPVFRLIPYAKKEVWEKVIDFTKFRKGGVPIERFLT